MASSSAVLKQQAAALELKKQPEKALALYQQLLEEHSGSSDVDVALRNRVGDLHLRVGQIDDAIALFEKSADEYALSGFLNNAIALCNKILRQRPGHVPTLRRLARFSAEKGMVVDAQRHYLSVAEALEKLGQHGEALKALSEFAELSPDDVHVRSVVIEQLLRAGRKPDALPHLTVLHRLHVMSGRSDEADGVAQVAREIDGAWEPDTSGFRMGKRTDPSLVFIDSDDDFGALETSPAPGQTAGGTMEGLELTSPPPMEFEDMAPAATLDGFESTSLESEPAPLDSLMLDGSPSQFEQESLGLDVLEPIQRDDELMLDAAPEPSIDFLDIEAEESAAVAALPPIPDTALLTPLSVPAILPPPREVTGVNHVPISEVPDLGLTDVTGMDLPRTVETVTGPAVPISPDPAAPRPADAKPPATQPPRPKRMTPTYVNLFDILHDDEPSSSRMTIGEPAQTGNHDADFDHILSEFRDGIEKTIPMDDANSHFDLGIAFREMGLMEDAIAEFQIAARSKSRRLEAMEAVGGCFLDKGDAAVARNVLKTVLDEHAGTVTDDALRGVLYLLGRACEDAGARDEGLRYYQRVYAVDIRFRDVAARIRTLQQPA
jgi:tetratricopeptide (TPR) repeat protein